MEHDDEGARLSCSGDRQACTICLSFLSVKICLTLGVNCRMAAFQHTPDRLDAIEEALLEMRRLAAATQSKVDLLIKHLKVPGAEDIDAGNVLSRNHPDPDGDYHRSSIQGCLEGDGGGGRKSTQQSTEDAIGLTLDSIAAGFPESVAESTRIINNSLGGVGLPFVSRI